MKSLTQSLGKGLKKYELKNNVVQVWRTGTGGIDQEKIIFVLWDRFAHGPPIMTSAGGEVMLLHELKISSKKVAQDLRTALRLALSDFL